MNWYWLITIAFFVIMFTVGDSNPYVQHKYENKIRELEKEIRYYRKEIEVSRKKLDDLKANKERLEHYAREEFFMKKPNEDVFIIVEK
jgi:cell division protein FtsB